MSSINFVVLLISSSLVLISSIAFRSAFIWPIPSSSFCSTFIVNSFVSFAFSSTAIILSEISFDSCINFSIEPDCCSLAFSTAFASFETPNAALESIFAASFSCPIISFKKSIILFVDSFNTTKSPINSSFTSTFKSPCDTDFNVSLNSTIYSLISFTLYSNATDKSSASSPVCNISTGLVISPFASFCILCFTLSIEPDILFDTKVAIIITIKQLIIATITFVILIRRLTTLNSS